LRRDKVDEAEKSRNGKDSLCHQRIELSGSCSRDVVRHLAFPDHVHCLNTGEDNAGTPEILEAHHGPGSTFDCPVILLHDVIQVLALSDPDGRFPLSVDALEGSQIGPAFIHGHGLRRAVAIDGLFKVAARRGVSRILCKRVFV
jgi:hypothetical protein